MATVTGLTSARMLAIEAASIVSGTISGDNLILTKFDGNTINAGNVRGATGPTGPDGNPIGTIIMGGWAAEPTNYKFLNGQTLVGGVAAYPTIATLFPSWVSSANLVLPNAMAGAVPMGAASALGIVSGSMTHTLLDTNLASHRHGLASHTHPIDHNHAVFTSAGGSAHNHLIKDWDGNNGTLQLAQVWSSGATTTKGISTYNAGSEAVASPESSHTHSIDVPAFTGSSTGPSVVNSDYFGSAIPVDHTPKNFTVKYAVKVL
jgi:hypothetical protein